MQERAVITLPLSPKKSEELGRLVTPVVGETISKAINGNFYLCVNLLDSYSDRCVDFAKYKENIDKHNIKYYNLWKDKEHIEKLLIQIEKLINIGYIYESTAEVYRCDCGVVEIEKKNIETCNPNKNNFIIMENEMFCNNCNSICKLYREAVLVFEPKNINLSDSFLPSYLNKDIKTFNRTLLSSSLVISRKRKTGISLKVNGNIYNIDIDFLWSTYLSLFSETEKIVICGNRELYQLFLVATIERCLGSRTSSIFIGTPIINGINDYNYEILSEEDIITKKLAILLSLKWAKKEKVFDCDVLKYCKKISFEKKKQLYAIICAEESYHEMAFGKIINDIMNERFNTNHLQKKLKLERRKHV